MMARMVRNTLKAAVIAVVALLAGCAGLPRHVQKTPSAAFQHPETTTLGQIVAADEIGKNLSGFRLLSSGEAALASLITLADHAERTLDIQYYIIHEDESTQEFLHHVRLAADRGVRVRLLVDDLNTAGEDRRFMHLSSHANVEVRVFNPFTAGRFSTWTRFIASATDIRRINHRMHNKLFVADDALAITGGRNIGDQYFTLDPRSNFVDLDVVAAGAIVPQLSASFDQFWNSKYAIPIASVASSVEAETKSAPPIESQFSDSDKWLDQELNSKKLELIWAPATVLADRPAKIASETSPDEELTIANDITELMGTAKQDLSIISPYFIPGKEGVALIAKLVAKRREGSHPHQLPGVHRFSAGGHRLCALPRAAAQARRRSAGDAPETGAEARALPSFPQLQCQPACQSAGDRSKDRLHRIFEHG